jgi:hypothetical protein
MLEELKNIDQSAIKELGSIKKEQETLQNRIDKMDEKRGKVSEAVFERVLSDYTARFDELEETARPLKDQARGEYLKLRTMLDEMATGLEEVRLAKEELTFRHELGEFSEKEFKSQLEEAEQRLQEREAQLEQGEKLKEKFVGAFHSEEDLESPEAAAPPPPALEPPAPEQSESEPPAPEQSESEPPAPEQSESEPPAPEQSESEPPDSEPPPLPEPPAEETTAELESAAVQEAGGAPPAIDSTTELTKDQLVAAEQAKSAAAQAEGGEEEGDDATALLDMPRFVSTAPDGSEEEYPLSMGTTTIGRLDTNDICIPNGEISRHHARIDIVDDGFELVDLDSENGVFVNGERVKKRLLADGDTIEVGPGVKEFVFRFEG